MNPAILLKLASAKKEFTANHPKFVSFWRMVYGKGITENTIIEISVQRPGEEKMTANIKVKNSDLELLQGIRDMMK